jgi:phage gp29-like protein
VLIDAADTICDVLILGQTSSTQIREGGGVGSGHAADLQGDVRKEKIMGCARRTAKIINVQMLPALCRVNFGDDSECPYLLPADKSGKDAKAVADRYQVILNTPGVKVSKQQYYEDNDLIVPDEDDETLSATPAAKPNTLPFGGNDNAGAADALDNAQGRGRAEMTHLARARGQDVPPDDSRLVDNALADATGIAPRWLGAVRPIFEELVAKAKDGSVNDADFISAVMKAQAKLPDVFGRMDHKALERVIEGTLGAAVVNGAVRGAMERHVRTATKSGGAR